MKNYCIFSKDKETDFILKYEIENDKITIYYADGTKEKRKYNKVFEKEILNKMEKQISDMM